MREAGGRARLLSADDVIESAYVLVPNPPTRGAHDGHPQRIHLLRGGRGAVRDVNQIRSSGAAWMREQLA